MATADLGTVAGTMTPSGTKRTTGRPTASLSLDLDNLWAYQMTHGDDGWQKFPSYLDDVVPIALAFLASRHLTITFFIVGQDAAIEANRAALATVSAAGHEIGNHSFHHRPWLHRLSDEALWTELTDAEDAITEATGARPRGFRGPGYSLSPATLRVLSQRGYTYDCSTLPTFIGPLARAYYFRAAHLDGAQTEERSLLFGSWAEGLRPVAPYRWSVPGGDGATIVEVPVTTFPGLRIPIHISYLLYLDAIDPRLATVYFRTALRACALAGVGPSLLLHPLDFLGSDDVAGLEFFPGMGMPGARKRERVGAMIDLFMARFTVVPVGEHVAQLGTTRARVVSGALSAPEATLPAVLGRLRSTWRRQGAAHV
jgi:peptidoglycan/xylan/chitin deacetylase (PgdA/CDA1 family)